MAAKIEEMLGDHLNLPEEQVRLALAIGLFASERVSIGQAARVAGLDPVRFRRELASRHIPLHYGLPELHEDMDLLDRLSRS